MSDLDLSKPVVTKSGKPVEIISTSGRGDYPVIGYIADSSAPDIWTASGEWAKDAGAHKLNLENIPQKRSGWVVWNKEELRTEWRGTDETRAGCERWIGRNGDMDHLVPAYIEWEE